VAPVGAAPGRDLTDQQAIGDKASVRDGKTIGSRKNVDFGAYMALLQRRIKSRWTPPRVPDSKRVQLIFKISPTGELLDLNLARSCGIAESDQAAMKAVREAAPFPHLPAGADEAVDIEFTFDYNVFNGGVRGGLGF
jgi:TonB family protein